MKELFGNSPSELLTLMIDGELDPTQETGLFTALAHNDELRSELRDMLSFRDSVRKDTEAYTPPATATGFIFGKAGFNIPTKPILPVASKVAASAGLLAGAKRLLWNPLMTAAMASLITALLLWNFQIDKPGNNVAAESKGQLASAIPSVEARPLVPSVATAKEVVVPKVIYRNVVERRPHNNYAESNSVSSGIGSIGRHVINAQQNTLSRNALASGLSLQQPDREPNTLNFKRRYIPMDMNFMVPNIIKDRSFTYQPMVSGSRKLNYDLMFNFRGIAAASFPNVDIGTQSDNILANMAFGAFLLHYGMLNFGLEIGSESFGQVFYNIENNRTMRYEQNPRFLWMGLALRGVWDENIKYLAGGQPYAQITLASTTVGPLAKALGGIQFVTENGVGISLGVEGSWLSFMNQGNWYYTKKMGLTYGMSMQF